MQMQREIFVLKGDYITPQDAADFYDQSQRLPRLRINECMQRQAIDLLHVKIMTDMNQFQTCHKNKGSSGKLSLTLIILQS